MSQPHHQIPANDPEEETPAMDWTRCWGMSSKLTEERKRHPESEELSGELLMPRE